MLHAAVVGGRYLWVSTFEISGDRWAQRGSFLATRERLQVEVSHQPRPWLEVVVLSSD